MPVRGPLPEALVSDYDAAHVAHNGAQAGPGGEPISAAPPPAGGETAGGGGGAESRREQERTPRNVKGPGAGTRARQAAGRFRTRWGGLGGGRKTGSRRRRKPDRGPRIPLTDMIEEAWEQLAWAAKPILPLNRILAVQAPFAGPILEDAVRDTFIDHLLQPAARADKAYRAGMGLLGPPVLVMVMLQTDQESPQFAWLHGMLRFSLLSLAKACDLNAEEAIARAETNQQASMQVDMLIAYIFSAPGTPRPGPPGPGTVPGEVIREDPAEAERADAEARMRQAFGIVPAGDGSAPPPP